ncbi:MAG: hypothetical protein ACU0CO_18325 [Shimia sp.]
MTLNRTRTLALLLALAAAPAAAQEQQAGNAASQDVEGTFQQLIEACDDTDMLMLRARIRLQLPRTTDEAAATAQEMLDQGFATCGEGDLEAGKATLTEALAIAEAGTAETFAVEETVEATPEAEPAADATETTAEDAAEDRPWWRFW